MKLKFYMFKYLPPFIWAGVIFILSSIPGSNYPPVLFNYSYLAHFFEFFILSILILRALGIQEKNIYFTLIIAVIYALSDEVHQMYIVDRSLSLIDWLVDFLAIIMGVKLWLFNQFDNFHLFNSKLHTK